MERFKTGEWFPSLNEKKEQEKLKKLSQRRKDGKNLRRH